MILFGCCIVAFAVWRLSLRYFVFCKFGLVWVLAVCFAFRCLWVFWWFTVCCLFAGCRLEFVFCYEFCWLGFVCVFTVMRVAYVGVCDILLQLRVFGFTVWITCLGLPWLFGFVTFDFVCLIWCSVCLVLVFEFGGFVDDVVLFRG